jgi:hypothetical protein
VLFPFVLGSDFQSPLLVDVFVCFPDLSLGDLVVDVCVNPSWFFSFRFPSQIRELRSSILGFSVLYWRDFFESYCFGKFWWT